MEIVSIVLLLIITFELTIILLGLIKLGKESSESEVKEVERKGRRDTEGIFANPLGDSYRKSSKKLYVPIIPNSKMLDGDEEDEV